MTPKLTRVVRLDSLPLNQTYFTEEGYLVDRPILTTIGIFEYTNPDGTIRRELRLPEEVFKEESLQSYKGKPIIITHDAGLITKDNVHDNAVGTILSEGYRSGNDVRAEIIIHDTDEMKLAGLKELSLGYNLDLDETPGEWNGQPYDAVQRNIVINHLALVLEARAGEQARLNIDSRDRKTKGAKSMSANPKTKKARRADGVMSPEDLAQAIAAYKTRRAERLAAKAQADQEGDTVPVADTKPTEGAAPAAENTDGDEDDIPTTNASEVGKSVLNVDAVDQIVRQRIQLGIVGRALNMDGLEDMGIMAAKKAVIRAVRPGMRLDGKSVAYINAAYDYAVADVTSRNRKDTSYQIKQMFNQDGRQTVSADDGDSSIKARQRMIDRQQNKKKEDK